MAMLNQGASASNLSSDNAPESEDEVRIVLPSSNYKDIQNPPRIPHGIVISGEASESDEEIDTHQALPQSASDFSISDTWGRSSTELSDKEVSKETQSIQYNTLLHKKLREKNQTLRRDIVELVTQPYVSATKEIHNISQQQSQLSVQDKNLSSHSSILQKSSDILNDSHTGEEDIDDSDTGEEDIDDSLKYTSGHPSSLEDPYIEDIDLNNLTSANKIEIGFESDSGETEWMQIRLPDEKDKKFKISFETDSGETQLVEIGL